jgi:signal transduction histidine kinase
LPRALSGNSSIHVCRRQMHAALTVLRDTLAVALNRTTAATRLIRGLLHAILTGLLVASTAVPAATPSPEPARIVLLTGADPIQPAALVQIRTLRNILERSAPHGAEVYLDALDGFRFGAEDLTPEFLALIRKKYANQRIDLVIGLGNHAANFAVRYHDQVWPGVPVLLSSIPDEWYGKHPLPAGFARVPFQIDMAKTLDIAERLQPDAHRLVVVGGATDTTYSYLDELGKLAAARRGRWTAFERWEGVPQHELEQRLSRLDTRTAVIFTTMYRDREGHRYFPYQLVGPMVAASGAPIYAWYSTYFDSGVTAGAVYDFEENARITAEAALSILSRGGHTEGLAFPALPERCTANVTELERYGLSASALPADCQLIHYPRSIFREYRAEVLAALAVLLAQAVTIVALLAQRRNRRRAEVEATSRRNELARAARFATVGELSASIAHEVGQPLGAILSNADAAQLLVRASHIDTAELEEILSDVKRDALRANDVVQRLRSLLQKQSVDFSSLPLDSTLQCALQLIAPEARRRGVTIETRFEAGDAEIMGDRVQIQQVVLNLAINAMDAMQDTEPASRVLTLTTRRVADGVEFCVLDRGCGLGAASEHRLFEPFYTTKAHGMGLGLSIVRSIVEAHQGRINVETRDGGKTAFIVRLPSGAEVADATSAAVSDSQQP